MTAHAHQLLREPWTGITWFEVTTTTQPPSGKEAPAKATVPKPATAPTTGEVSEPKASKPRAPKPTPLSGAAAACAAADMVVAGRDSSKYKHQLGSLAHAVASTVHAAAAASSPPRLRPTDKLRGHNTAIHLGATPGESLADVAADWPTLKVLTAYKGGQKWSKTLHDVGQRINDQPGCTLLVDDIKHNTLTGALHLAVNCLRTGGHIVLRLPSDSHLWLDRRLTTFVTYHNLSTTTAQVGTDEQLEKNPTKCNYRFVSSHIPTINNLLLYHQTEYNPQHTENATNRRILASRWRYLPYAPAMPLKAKPTAQGGHREKELEPLQQDLLSQIPGMVTKLLDRREWDDKARAALRKEAEALVAAGTWNLDTVREKEELVEESKRTGKPIVLGDLMSIVSIKHFEHQESERKHKGRIVHRGDSAKDAHGAPALYQDLASTPTTLTDVNANIAYGMIPGFKTTCDAVQAYVQATLSSKHPTWVSIPPELQPAEWRGRFRRPCCLLQRALYGHPEAGAHWQAHLHQVLTTHLQATPIPTHMSSYSLPGGLFLTVYVDDLMISGPEGLHDSFWQKLNEYVKLEAPETLDRFLGRDHKVVAQDSGARRVVYDMRSYAEQTIKHYVDITKCTNLRAASTPFVPEGAVAEEDDSARARARERCKSTRPVAS